MPAHGTTARYHRGCRCDRCRSRYAAYHRGWRKRKRTAEAREKAEELRALRERHRVAIELRTRGALGGEEALLAVVWPRNERLLEARYVREWSDDVRREAVDLYRRGWSLPVIEAELGLSEGTIKAWLRQASVRRGSTVARVTVTNRSLVA